MALYRLTSTPANLRPRYNVCPTTTIDVVRDREGGRELVSMRWGLVPTWWSKPLKQVPAAFNAQAESVAEKPMFRSAYKARRSIIPASGYYEWQAAPDGKQPHYLTAVDGGPLSIAEVADIVKLVEATEAKPAKPGPRQKRAAA